MRMYDYATSGDTAEAKLVNGPELHTLTPNVMLYHGEFDPSSLYWAVEVRSPNGEATIHAGMDGGNYAWAIYIFKASAADGVGDGVQAGPGAKSPGFDALPDHSNECNIVSRRAP